MPRKRQAVTSGTPSATMSRHMAMVLLAISASACGGSDEDPFVDTSALPLRAPVSSCTALVGTRIPAASIGLPTTGARVTAASVVAAAPETVGATSVTRALPEYCRVLGSIDPVDAAAPPINFQLNIPTQWNQKTIQVGGGGLNGSIPGNLATIAQLSARPSAAPFRPTHRTRS